MPKDNVPKFSNRIPEECKVSYGTNPRTNNTIFGVTLDCTCVLTWENSDDMVGQTFICDTHREQIMEFLTRDRSKFLEADRDEEASEWLKDHGRL